MRDQLEASFQKFITDITALVRQQAIEALSGDGELASATLRRRVAGEIVENELEFQCVCCGWNKSLQFDGDEMKALGNNIRKYTGPCPGCNLLMLVPKDTLFGVSAPSKARPKKVAAGQKRDPKVLAKLVEDLHAHISKNAGANIETIARDMKQSSGALALPIAKLLASKRIKKTGQKRATRYFPAGK